MPAYNFQRQFVPMILDLSKPHTIRRRRAKRPTVPGDMLSLYTGMRTKQCILIAVAKCVRVDAINIYPGRKVMHNDIWLSGEDIELLAKRDGFENKDKFFEFFENHYALPTSDFEMIWWDTTTMITGSSGEMKLHLGGAR